MREPGASAAAVKMNLAVLRVDDLRAIAEHLLSLE
jgi:hypothetical protein